MAELLSPGVFIEETASNQNVIQGVSTSNMGVVGFSPRGPEDSATLVTTYDQYVRVFGPDTKNSYMPKTIAAFFANGGRRAFVVRVTPTDATKSNCQIQSSTYDQLIETGTGAAVAFTRTAATSPIKDNEGACTVVPGSLSLRWRGTGASLVGDQTMARNGTTALVGNGTRLDFEGRVNPYPDLIVGAGNSAITYRSVAMGNQNIRVEHVVAGNSTPRSVTAASVGGITTITVNVATDGAGAVDVTETATSVAASVNSAFPTLVVATAGGTGAGLVGAAAAASLVGAAVTDVPMHCVTSANVVLEWTSLSGAKSLTFPATGDIVSASNADATGTFDRQTGIFSFKAVEAPLAAITVTCTLTTGTLSANSGTAVNANGQIDILGTGLASGGGIANACFIDVTDGSYSITFASAPHNGAKILASYKVNSWDVNPISKGAWGEGIRLDIKGDENYYSPVTQSYSKFTMLVSLKNSTGAYEVMESHDEIDFTDPDSATYFPDVVNDLSDLVRVSEPGGNEAPGELSGSFGENQDQTITYAVGGGDEISGSRAFSFSVPSAPVGKRSVTITYTSAVDGSAKTITDDGNGNLVGSTDPSVPNTIVYSTGTLSFSTAATIRGGTLVAVKYAEAPAESRHVEYFGATLPPPATVAKTYSFTKGSQAYSYYAAGSDGTFSISGATPTYGRNVMTEMSTLQPSYRGVYALDRVDELMQVVVPDLAGDVAATGDLLDYAAMRESMPSGGDRFVILTTPRGKSPQGAVEWLKYDLAKNSKFAAVYWPWVKVNDPLSNGRKMVMPPLGHVAGIYARTDSAKNVGKSPGGTVDGALRYVAELEYEATQGERDYVYPNKINPLITSLQTGMAVWGVRTIAAESEWRYINIRRLFMFLEKSVYNSTHWIVFENNGPVLWAKVNAQLGSFLSNLYNDGYFAGNNPAQAYKVVCDASNNPQSSIDAGQVVTDVAVAGNKPSEFVRFRFSQMSL